MAASTASFSFKIKFTTITFIPNGTTWDHPPFFSKIIFADYDDGYAFIELLGEWNDILYNDIMFLKRDIVDSLIENGIDKFILIGENVLNFHAGDDCYYEEWAEDIPNGWIALLNFREHVLHEMQQASITHYFVQGGNLDQLARPLFQIIEQRVTKKLEPIEMQRTSNAL